MNGEQNGVLLAVMQNLETVSRFLGGTFLIFLLIFLGILIFMTISNCVIYGIIITEDQKKDLKIDQGYAIFMLVMNIIGLLVIVFLFFWILFKFKAYKNKIKETIQYVIRSINDAKQCRKILGDSLKDKEKLMNALNSKDFITNLYKQMSIEE
jgi:hypothetical protein